MQAFKAKQEDWVMHCRLFLIIAWQHSVKVHLANGEVVSDCDKNSIVWTRSWWLLINCHLISLDVCIFVLYLKLAGESFSLKEAMEQ